MIKKIINSEKLGNSHISILFPGKSLNINDTGIGSIGRIDQANIDSGTTIKMHPHINDEILSYFRTGKVEHLDSNGNRINISRNKLMLMKAGKVFYHEEKINDRLEGLQIFIRPKNADYEPEVIFYDLEKEDSMNNWRLLASNNTDTKLNFTSETEIFDMHITNQDYYELPKTSIKNPIAILYTFQGEMVVNNEIKLTKGESLIIKNEKIKIKTTKTAELVYFVTNEFQECFKSGMFSGNQN